MGLKNLKRIAAGVAIAGGSPAWDVPVPGDYDGDGKADMAVYRPDNGVWYQRRSIAGDTPTTFGTTGDLPLPLPAAIRQASLGG